MVILQTKFGTCDAKCYHANSDPAACRCICGGRNHGKGLDSVVEDLIEQNTVNGACVNWQAIRQERTRIHEEREALKTLQLSIFTEE